MIKTNDGMSGDNPFQLNRFIQAQDKMYDSVLEELREGQKQSHWMWYIFPQIDGLALSATSKYYAIKSIEEAQRYLHHPVLGMRLVECAKTVLAIEGRSISQIFGYPDDIKLKSSMSLFGYVAAPHSVFIRSLDKYFNGERDDKTLRLLDKLQDSK
jgi:uncharacterized protein (DUF1810 family)